MNMNPGKKIHPRHSTPVPMPDEVIKMVELFGIGKIIKLNC